MSPVCGTGQKTVAQNKKARHDYFVDDKVIDVNMHRLRGKIEDEPAQPKHLVTIWGMGYKWIV